MMTDTITPASDPLAERRRKKRARTAAWRKRTRQLKSATAAGIRNCSTLSFCLSQSLLPSLSHYDKQLCITVQVFAFALRPYILEQIITLKTFTDVSVTSQDKPCELLWRVKQMIARRRQRNGHGRNRRGRIIHSPIYGNHAPKERRIFSFYLVHSDLIRMQQFYNKSILSFLHFSSGLRTYRGGGKTASTQSPPTPTS